MQNEFDDFSSDNQVGSNQPVPSSGRDSRLSSQIGGTNGWPGGGKGGSASSLPITALGKGVPPAGISGGGSGGKGVSGDSLPAKKSDVIDGLESKAPGGDKGMPSIPISGKHGGQKDALKSDDKAVKREGQKELAKNVQHAKGGTAGKIAEANKQGGTKAAAGEAIRQGAKQGLEKGLQYGADALTAGGAEAARPVIKAVGKTFEWLSRDKRWLKLGLVIAIPNIVVIMLIAYIIMDPFGAIRKIGMASFSAFKKVAGNAIAGSGNSASWAINDLNKKAEGLAINQIGNLAPEPGTITYKLLNIDAAKIQNSTVSSGIPFDIKTKQIAGPAGKTYNVLDAVVNKTDGTTYKMDCVMNPTCPDSNQTIRGVVSSILTSSIPILQMSIRSPQARKLNKAPDLDLTLNYGEKKGSNIFDDSYKNIKNYLDKKTTKRVRGTNIALPPISSYGSTEYKEVVDSLAELVSNVQKIVSDGGDPNDLDIQPPDPYTADQMKGSPKRISNVLCAFNAILLDPSSISASIESRANAARRDGAKFMTISDTNQKGAMVNQETSYSISQLENFTKSASYQRAAYGRIMGDSVDPEGSSQTALTIGRTNSILASVSNACSKLLYIDQMRKTEGISSLSNKVVDDEYRSEINKAKVTNADLVHYHVNDSGGACNTVDPINPTRNDCASFAFRIAVMRNYFQPIQQAIYDDSDNYFSSPNNVTPLDIIQRLVRVGGGAAVTGREVGKQNYNRFAQGLQQLNYDWLQAYGGRFLTDAEQNTLALNQAKVRDWQNKNYGVAWRLYNTDNISSVASQIIQHIPPEPSQAIGAILNGILDCILNPIKTLASLDGLTSYVITGQTNIASAADTSVYDDAKFYKISPIGFTDQESLIDWQSNARLIETLKKNNADVVDPDPLANGKKIPATQLFSKWDKCFISKITSSYYLSGEYLTKLKTRIDELNNPNSQLMRGMDDDDKGKVQATLSDLQTKYTRLMGCKPLLSAEANDINSLPVQYRVYHSRSTFLDLLTNLSTDQEDDSVYAMNDSESNNTNTDPDTPTNEPVIDGSKDTSSQQCPAASGVVDAGIGEKYKVGKILDHRLRLCKVQGITVNVSIANNLNNLLNAIHSAGIPLSGSGYRTFDRQVALRSTNGCPDTFQSKSSSCRVPTARPGESNHENGEAIDFSVGGSTIGRGSAAFRWLQLNAATYGFKNLPSEAWHWSINGR